jgi:hypothetical protein
MTDVSGIAPKFSKWQMVDGIYGWTDYGQNGVWTPGISFKGGTTPPQIGNSDKDLFIKIPENHLYQYQTGNGWVDLGSTSSNLASYGTTDPTATQYGFINRLDQSTIKQWINHYNNWVSMGSNNNGLPIGNASMKFTDDETQKSVNLYLIIDSDGLAPLLATDQGLVVKKDIAAGGILTSNQGILALGNGLNYIDEPPKILLMHSNGYGNKDTLYLKQFGGSVSAHLDLGDLTAHGTVSVTKLHIVPGGTPPSPQDGDIWIVS